MVTRRNDRTLSTGRRWVKNGDQWVVTATNRDGSMTIKRAAGGGEVVLPADYVRQHVELGYASTAHRAQGRTVDTAHAMVAATTTREVLYVAATRGRSSNRLYVDTCYDPDQETSHGPVSEQTAHHVLTAVLANVGADLAAHTVLRHEQDNADSIAALARQYLTIAREAQAERWDALISRSGLTPQQFANAVESHAYGPLLAALRTAESRGLDVDSALPQLVRARPLDDAHDIASVLHERVDRWVAAANPGRRVRDRSVAGLIARADGVTDPDLRRALDERAEAMERRAVALLERALRNGEAWIGARGEPPTDALLFAQWAREARTVAAYRELHNIRDETPAALTQAGSAIGIGEARAAVAAWQRARTIADEADGPSSRRPSADAALATIELGR